MQEEDFQYIISRQDYLAFKDHVTQTQILKRQNSLLNQQHLSDSLKTTQKILRFQKKLNQDKQTLSLFKNGQVQMFLKVKQVLKDYVAKVNTKGLDGRVDQITGQIRRLNQMFEIGLKDFQMLYVQAFQVIKVLANQAQAYYHLSTVNQSKISSMQAQNTALNLTLKQSQYNLKFQSQRIKTLFKELDEERKRNQNILNEKSSLSIQLAQQNKKLVKTNTQLEQTISQSNDDRQKLKMSLSQNGQLLLNQREYLIKLEQMSNKKQALCRQLKQLLNKKKALHLQNQDLKQQYKSCSQQVKSLQIQLSTKATLQKQCQCHITSLTSQLQTLQSDLQTAMSQTNKSVEKISFLQKEILLLRNQISQAQNLLQSKDMEIISLRFKVQKGQDYRQVSQELKKEIQLLKMEIRHRSDEINRNNRQINQMDIQYKKKNQKSFQKEQNLEKHNQSLIKDNQLLKESISNIQGQLQTKNGQIYALKRQLHNTICHNQAVVENMKKQLLLKQQQVDRNMNEISQLDKVLDENCNQVFQLRQKNKRLQQLGEQQLNLQMRLKIQQKQLKSSCDANYLLRLQLQSISSTQSTHQQTKSLLLSHQQKSQALQVELLLTKRQNSVVIAQLKEEISNLRCQMEFYQVIRGKMIKERQENQDEKDKMTIQLNKNTQKYQITIKLLHQQIFNLKQQSNSINQKFNKLRNQKQSDLLVKNKMADQISYYQNQKQQYKRQINKARKETEEIKYKMNHYIKVFESEKTSLDQQISSMKQYIEELERNLQSLSDQKGALQNQVQLFKKQSQSYQQLNQQKVHQISNLKRQLNQTLIQLESIKKIQSPSSIIHRSSISKGEKSYYVKQMIQQYGNQMKKNLLQIGSLSHDEIKELIASQFGQLIGFIRKIERTFD